MTQTGMPQTEGHPLWPAFKAWAADHLPDLMLAAYWECWKAAHQAGAASERDRPERARRVRSRGLTPIPGRLVVGFDVTTCQYETTVPHTALPPVDYTPPPKESE